MSRKNKTKQWAVLLEQSQIDFAMAHIDLDQLNHVVGGYGSTTTPTHSTAGDAACMVCPVYGNADGC